MKSDAAGTIIEKRQPAPNHVWMRIANVWGSEAAEPGQFLHLLLPDQTGLLLRRPYTIYRRRPDEVEILFQVVGSGSGALAELPVGSEVKMIGPLGNSFRLPKEGQTAYLVGGGVGMASLFLLAERLAQCGSPPRVFIGARSAEYLLCRDDLESLGLDIHIATDDGSDGYHGFVTDLFIDSFKKESVELSNPAVYTCGPKAMMEALSSFTTELQLPAQSALENRMGCAMGVCLGCVVPIQKGGEMEYERVCIEGPVFDSRRVLWSRYRI